MEPQHVETGVCGLSCRLCPRHHMEGESRCSGCKGEMRMAVGCPFITCALKRKGIEFCWLTGRDVIRHEMVQRIVEAWERFEGDGDGGAGGAASERTDESTDGHSGG